MILYLQPYLHNCSWWYLLAFGSLGWYFRRKEMLLNNLYIKDFDYIKFTYLCFRHRWIVRCTFLRQRWNTQFFACICMYLWRQPLQVVLLDLDRDRCPSQYPSHNYIIIDKVSWATFKKVDNKVLHLRVLKDSHFTYPCLSQ